MVLRALAAVPFVFFPILGFGESQYAGPAGPDKWGQHQVSV